MCVSLSHARVRATLPFPDCWNDANNLLGFSRGGLELLLSFIKLILWIFLSTQIWKDTIKSLCNTIWPINLQPKSKVRLPQSKNSPTIKVYKCAMSAITKPWSLLKHLPRCHVDHLSSSQTCNVCMSLRGQRVSRSSLTCWQECKWFVWSLSLPFSQMALIIHDMFYYSRKRRTMQHAS